MRWFAINFFFGILFFVFLFVFVMSNYVGGFYGVEGFSESLNAVTGKYLSDSSSDGDEGDYSGYTLIGSAFLFSFAIVYLFIRVINEFVFGFKWGAYRARL
jgi:hypothetical protein